jgi:cell wall-associated NlpC family hydrolase
VVTRAIGVLGAASVAVALLVILLASASISTPGGRPASAARMAGAPTALARADIPPDYLAWYLDAAGTCPGLPWSVLAGIGTVESGNGTSHAPGVHAGHNFAGAEGPMQFEPATFAAYAVNADPAGRLTPYNPADAIYTAAAMLCANGARGGSLAGIRRAVYAYNHATWYVTKVLTWAGKYTTRTRDAAAAAIAFAEEQIGKPSSYDSSGLACAAYGAAGIHIARTTQQWRQDGPVIPLSHIRPGDLLFSAGPDGTARPGHVVMYLGGGQVIQAPKHGEDVQIDPLDLAGIVVATRPASLQAKP